MSDDCITEHRQGSVVGLQPLSLKKNVAWTFVGNVVSALCQWSILVVLAKIGSPLMVGQYAMGLAVAGPVLMFASLQLRKIQATDSRREFRFGDYLGLILLSSFVGCCVVLSLAWWDSNSLETLLVISLVGLSKSFELIADTFYGLLQQHERLDRITKSSMLHSLLSTVSLGLGVWLTNNIVVGTACYATAKLGIILAYDIPGTVWILNRGQSSPLGAALSEIWPRWEWSRLRPLVVLGLPMGVVSLLTSLQTNIPRYFVEEQFGEADLGIFCAIAALMMTGITLMRALDQSCIPRFAKLHAAHRYRDFRWLFLKLIAIYLLLGVAGVWVARWGGRPLLTLLFSAEYAIHVDVLEMIMLAAVAAYLVGAISSALVASRCIHSQLPLLCVSLLTALTSCSWLVPEYGLWGAAMSFVICKLPYIAVGSWLLLRATREELVQQEPSEFASPSIIGRAA